LVFPKIIDNYIGPKWLTEGTILASRYETLGGVSREILKKKCQELQEATNR
jgi:hypothetical protein